MSNRGHESIAIFRVKQGCGSKGKVRGSLTQVGFFHTRGETPRHFQFDHSGQFLLVANQDSDTLAVFSFNMTSGEIKYTGNDYHVPSPNFVCCCPLADRDSYEYDAAPTNEEVGFATSANTTNNTVPTSVEFDHSNKYNVDLPSELELARKEIADLKQQLSSLQVQRDASAQ